METDFLISEIRPFDFQLYAFAFHFYRELEAKVNEHTPKTHPDFVEYPKGVLEKVIFVLL